MSVLREFGVFENLDIIDLNIKSIFIMRRNALFISHDSKVYEFGFEQLANLTSTHDHKESPRVKAIQKLNDKQIIEFAGGMNHMIALISENHHKRVVYIWGYNNFGQIGNGKFDPNLEQINTVEYFENTGITIKNICCGANHTLALSTFGKVYAWGDNEFGQTGNGNDGGLQLKPILLDGFGNEKISTIICGATHSLALTKSGRVFSWGNNKFGQLGFNDCNMYNKPRLIELSEQITKIRCGENHTLLLSEIGKLYIFGKNDCGQVGNGINENQMTPLCLENENKFCDIAANFECNISIALTMDNVYYIWGKCGDNCIFKPESTELKSFNNIFIHYFQKTYGLSELSFQYDNGFYEKQFKQIGEYIDRGSYGTVYMAQKKEMDKGFYAIKKIKPIFNDQKAIVLKEVRVLSKLDCNYIVRYYHSWFEQNREERDIICSLFIQMELCDGNLEDFNENIINVSANISSIDENSILTPAYYLICCRVFNELVECVDYLHEQKIIHRDLRPANILLSCFPYERFIKIGDFGHATRHKSDEKEHTKIEADIKYVAPEIENGEKHNEKADIYSLGKMMKLFFRIENYNKKRDRRHSLNSKYESLKKLIIKMENEDFNSRPNCENILIMKKSWFLDKRDSKAVQELKILEKNLESDEKLNDSSIHKVVKLILKQERNSRLNEEFFTQKAIDSGSYGQIVKAKHIRTKIVYAIRKILIGSGFEDKFLKGFKMVSKLKSDNIVHYETFWIEKQYLCIQMEYCEQTLKDMKLEFDNHLLDKNGILSQVGYYTMSEIFKQILEGVNYLHEQNPPIIHSNLKTENILISDIKGKKQIKISNFSSAQTQSQEDKPIGVDLEILNFKPLKQEIIKICDSKEDIHDLGLILGNLFNIENQRSQLKNRDVKVNCSEIIAKKYENLMDLFENMTHKSSFSTCNKILSVKCDWALNTNEFDIKTEIEKLPNDNDFIESNLLPLLQDFIPEDVLDGLTNCKTFKGSDFWENENSRLGNEFTLINEISKGNFSRVFAVQHKLDKFQYALKLVNLKISSLKMIAEKEVEILAKLQNSYVVHYKTSWIENLRNQLFFCIQMELCDRNLKDLLIDINSDSKLKTENRLSLLGYYLCSEITIEIFEAFKYLHEQKIIHLCVKPSNILIKNVKSGKVIRISGFSSSFKFLSSERNELKIKSKYMAPEVIKNNIYDTKADIFSLGLCLSQMFDIEKNEKYKKDKTESKLLTPKYSRILDLLDSMKQGDPKNRPTCEKILENKNLWSLNDVKFNVMKKFETILEYPQTNNNHYIYSIIKLKYKDFC